MGRSSRTWLLRGLILVVVVGAGFLAWQALKPAGLPEGIAGSNGRIEATEIGIAAETPGRIAVILAEEGDLGSGHGTDAGFTLALQLHFS